MKTRHWDRIGNGGVRFTELGFGAAPIGNLYRAISDDQAHATLSRAWDLGVRYFDTAPLYGLGLSETRVNRFLRDKPRDDYVLSTKVGRLLRRCEPGEKRDCIGKFFEVPARKEVYDYTHDGVMRSVEFSLERLGVDSIDILFAHDLDIFNHGSQEALDAKLDEFMAGGYKALLSLRDQGVIKAFGAGVNEWQPCQSMAERGDFDLFLLAGRYTLLEQQALESFLPLAVQRGIGIIIGGPYNSGVLATGAKPGAFYNYDPAPQHILDRVARIDAVCKRHGVRMVDAAFQFPLCHPAVVSVIPGGQGVAEVEANLDAARASIPSALWAELKADGLMRDDAPVPA
ncbi:aldo/keto reductase [Hoeflea sp. YIM 152468]|uniref:aldo/keto reductase n=1 Tax=Hoeflea sp. YIM 152468 TaxID=3031759 RepID=UPI0023DBE0D7|nr:aldo/keto reductase [Hoeflea sp. YIM 152468]MDF1606853.1 aldo/keto reductase [Hoeflea sp. YIM 152468]